MGTARNGTVSSERGDGTRETTAYTTLSVIDAIAAGKTLRGFRFPGCVWAKKSRYKSHPYPLG